ncbi:MAG: DUF2889 domain-containing protein [Rhodospirillales bacterium]|nr:DUF2889 domain-containing protein [Rhodospirillales bacterium]
MPLSDPAPRRLSHTRAITIHGYAREDGLYDIEAELTDRRAEGFASRDRGWIEPGGTLHGMKFRLTVDDRMLIHASEAATEFGPFNQCAGGAANFSRLAGLTIKPGFLREAAARVHGTQGCTHLRELIQQLATVAFQTLWPVRMRRERAAADAARAHGQQAAHPAASDASARLLNSCFAYASYGPVVRERWPHLYTGPAGEGAGSAAGEAAPR